MLQFFPTTGVALVAAPALAATNSTTTTTTTTTTPTPATSSSSSSSSAAAGDTCEHSLNFFPSSSTNVPDAWTAEAQTALGNTVSNSLIPITLTGDPTPELHVVPVGPLTSSKAFAGTSVCACVPSSTGRRLQTLGQRRLAAACSKILLTPASFKVKYSINGSAEKDVGGTYTMGDKAKPVPSITLPELANYPDVSGCG